MVCQDGPASGTCAQGKPHRQSTFCAGAFPARLRKLAATYSRLVHFTTDLVGPPASRLVLLKRSRNGCGTSARRMRHLWQDRTAARPRYARHLVFKLTLAVQHTRLA